MLYDLQFSFCDTLRQKLFMLIYEFLTLVVVLMIIRELKG